MQGVRQAWDDLNWNIVVHRNTCAVNGLKQDI